MNLIIKKLNDNSDDWNLVQLKSENSTFLTHSSWLEFQKANGRNINQFVIYLDKIPVGIFYTEIWKRKIAKYAYLPRGPVFYSPEGIDERMMFNEIFIKLKDWGKSYCKENNLNAFRIDPLIEISFQKELEKIGWKESFALGQVKNTWIMKLGESSEELLKKQKKDTRYYIKRATNKGAEIYKITKSEEVEEFIKVMNETKQRNNFWGYADEYYRLQWNMLNIKGNNSIISDGKSLCEIYVAKYEGKIISGALINYSNDTAHYAHGASSSEKQYANLASPYSVLWKAISDANEEGYKYFDFWGVIPKGVNHEWRGLSDFKMKFEGDFTQYVGNYEIYNNLFKYKLQQFTDWWNYRKLRF